MSLRHSRFLASRLVVLGCSRSLAGDIISQVSRWVECSGPEWTVNRLKQIKTAFISFIADVPYDLTVTTTRDGKGRKIPKGPFGALWKSAFTKKNGVVRALNAMMIYSDFIAPAVTEKQWKKFHLSATRLPSPPGDIQVVLDQIRVPRWMRVKGNTALSKIEEFVVGKGYTPTYTARQISQFIDCDTSMVLWEEYPQYKECCHSLSRAIDARFRHDDFFGYHEPLTLERCVDPVGVLGVSQEPGYKLRVFASPNIVHQCAMSRLKEQLFSLLRQVRWDCTYDQSSGTDWIKEQLDLGHVVWSIDLSDATNNFPLSVQLQVLREIGCREDDIGLFEALSRSPWKVTHASLPSVKWTVGQPLGLGPSFAAFALTHGVLVHSLATQIGEKDSFRILGDDIVIRGDALANRYLTVLGLLGIPVSKDKTIRSSLAGEFAGKLVTRDGILATTKWKMPSDRSFLDFARNLGPTSIALLPRRQQVVAKFVSSLPEPQGFGWNPQGVPSYRRLKVLEMFEEVKPQRCLVFRQINRLWPRYVFAFEEPYLKPDYGTGYYREPLTFHDERWGVRPLSRRPGEEWWETSLRVSVDTGAPFKVPQQDVTDRLRRELRKHGFIASVTSTDPRGLELLKDLEMKIAAVEANLEANTGWYPWWRQGMELISQPRDRKSVV